MFLNPAGFKADGRARDRREPHRARSATFRFGRFLEPDPIGFEGGMNLYAYVENDPVNLTDPEGLDPPRICTGTLICPQAQNGGYYGSFGVGQSGRSFGSDGYFIPVRPTNPAGTDADGGIVATASFRWVSTSPFDLYGFASRSTLRREVHAPGNLLDRLADDYLQPPEGRRASENYLQCVNRISGPGSAALGTVGAAGVGAGGPWLGYSRVGFGGGGQGTSLISAAARSLGRASVGGRYFGSGNLGGVAGRALSGASVLGGAALGGIAVGTTVGALQRCR